MAGRLIVTNGDVAVARLKEAGLDGAFLPWRDPLHEGPVPPGLFRDALSLVRAQFLAREFGKDLFDVMHEFAARDAVIGAHADYERIELLFEHDLYDQLQLIELLEFFSAEGRTEGIFLVQAQDYIGTLPRSALRVLVERAVPVSQAQIALARRSWKAFTAATPELMASLARSPTPELPHLASAFARLLQELPAEGSGLGLTQERTLALLARAPHTVADLFAATQAQEQARYLGDASYFRLLDRLVFAPSPLIAGLEVPSTRCMGGAETADYRAYAAARVDITEHGREALAGQFDHAIGNAIDRWFGGVHVTVRNLWRRKAEGGVRPG